MDIAQQTICTTLSAIERTASRKEKEAILKQALNSPQGKELQQALVFANDPYTIFGVKVNEDIPQTDNEYSWDAFVEKLNMFADGSLSGNVGKIASLWLVSTKDAEWNYWATKIINKDLRIGAAAKTINKAAGKELIKEFNVSLCESLDPNEDGADNLVSLLGNKFIIEPKYNGWRCTAHVKGAIVKFYTREGKFIANTHIIEKELVELHKVYPPPKELVYDGELKARTFTETESILSSDTAELSPDIINELKFYIFDVVHADYFFSQGKEGESVTLSVRKESLSNVSPSFGEHLVNTPYEDFDPKSLNQYKKHLEEGYEGSVIKNKELPYRFNRSTTEWYKIKPTLDCDLTIISFEEGDNKFKGSLGAITASGELTNKAGEVVQIKVSVGTGFKEALRSEIWANQEAYLGKIIEVKYQELSKAKNSDTWSLQFPRFVRIRNDKII